MSIKQGDYLKKLRAENHLSQEKLAEKLGVSRQSVSKWEQGYAVPDTDNMQKLSKLYGLSVDELLSCGERQETPSAQTVSREQEDIPTEAAAAREPEKAVQETEKPPKKKRSWLFYAYPAVAVFVTALLGVINSSLWKSSWICILTIPVFYTSIIAYEKKNKLIFCYPVVVLIVFFIGGFHFGLWHPLWILFLTIPIYYIGAAVSYKNKKHKK